MSWKEHNVVEKRLEFVRLCEDGRYTMTELCERFGVSRNNGYKWLKRYREEGLDGLVDRRRIPGRAPHHTSAAVEELLLAERDAHPTWGPRKILAVLARNVPDVPLPAASTVYEILKRNGRIHAQGRRRKHQHPGKPFVEMDLPNSVWAADYKGDFKLGNARRCYPLTVTDGYSRYLLACQALSSTKLVLAKPVFQRIFKEYGLPDAILTDNGSPFASIGLSGLSQLSVWWLRLGIRPLRIEPGHPQQNGRHERMHRTLKQEATKPPMQTVRAQQKVFDAFRTEYNEVRPHEALGQVTPASVYERSARPYPARLPPVDYPSTFVTRLVSASGGIRWCSKQIFVTTALAGQHIGLEEVDDGIWNVYFATAPIAKLDARTATIK